MQLKDFFTSGWEFSQQESDLKNKFQMMNIALVLSSIAFITGIVVNFSNSLHDIAIVELCLLGINIGLFFLLRVNKRSYDFVAFMVTAQVSILLIVLIYVSDPTQMKHAWFFTYPIILLYLRKDYYAFLWFVFLIGMMFLAPLQPFIVVKYTLFQVSYITLVLLVIGVIVYFYREKMEEAKELIASQQKMLTVQSKQAVMGEMIAMIAHQWRQPLSAVTLNISNIQVKKLLGEDVASKEIDQVLENVSDTVVYLSETIDDFQTYFKPNKNLQTVRVDEIVAKVINFVSPRLKNSSIEIKTSLEDEIVLYTYANELIQVLLNIVHNAIDEVFEKDLDDGTITIKIESFKKRYIKISICDNAGGIQRSDLQSIFEPYVSTKGKNGTGLGLYMSQMIIEKQFNSKIIAKNKGDGAVFELVIPKTLA